MKRSFLHWLVSSAFLGLVVPFVFIALQAFDLYTTPYWGQLLHWAWPSAIWLMATDGIEGTFRAYVFVAMSLTANVLVYSAAGSIVWCLKRALTRAHA